MTPTRYHCHALAARHALGPAQARGLGYTHGYDAATPDPSLTTVPAEYEDAYLRGMADRAAVEAGTYSPIVRDTRRRPPVLV